MKYLIILYVKYNDGKPDKKSMYDADTAKEAISSWHGYMNAQIKDTSMETFMCMVVNEKGMVLKMGTPETEGIA